MPALYLKSTTTFARYTPSADLREIDPTGFDAPPREPLASAAFSMSPAPPRLQPGAGGVCAGSGSGWVDSAVAGASVAAGRAAAGSGAGAGAGDAGGATACAGAAETGRGRTAPAAPEPIVESFYAMPIYTGIIIMNPPEKKPPAWKDPRRGKRRGKGMIGRILTRMNGGNV